MAGNRRHAGGMNSAMANLKKIDGEIAARKKIGSSPVSGVAEREG